MGHVSFLFIHSFQTLSKVIVRFVASNKTQSNKIWWIFQRGEKIWQEEIFIPEFDYRPDDQAQIIIDGVESEQVEEENDALNDMRAELGIVKYYDE